MSSFPTDGELTASSPAARRPINGTEPPRGDPPGKGAGHDVLVVPSELKAPGPEAPPGALPTRRRDSFIPLPEGFRPRPSTGPGLDFATALEPAAHQDAAAKDPPAREPALAPQPEPAREPEPSPASRRTTVALPRLILEPIEAPKLIYERLHEPSEQSPILYRERAYLVDGLQSDDELEEQLESELAAIQQDWRERDTSQFVQLALFDHSFEGEPTSPPIATLSWKDWHGKKELWVRGVRRSTLPPRTDLDLDLGTDAAADEEAGDSEPIPLVQRHARASRAPVGDALLREGAEPESRPPDSGPAWQSPDKSGEYLIPNVDEAPVTPPSSQRVLASEELIGVLFERMHDLRYLPDVGAAASYVLDIIEEHIPCDGALIHVFDIETREFVVIRALGPRHRSVLLQRTIGVGSHLEEALRRQTTIDLPATGKASSHALWPALGITPDHILCAPVHEHGRYLGAIELARESTRTAFSEGQIGALEYICEQFADFVADRPVDLAPDSLLPPPS